MHLDAKSPEEMIEPAVAGVFEILRSVEKHGSVLDCLLSLVVSFNSSFANSNKVERFIYTSSCGTIKAFTPVPQSYTEEDWNDQAVEDCKKFGPNSLPNDMYCASKTLAEKGSSVQVVAQSK